MLSFLCFLLKYSLAYACLKLVNYSFFFWLPYYLSNSKYCTPVFYALCSNCHECLLTTCHQTSLSIQHSCTSPEVQINNAYLPTVLIFSGQDFPIFDFKNLQKLGCPNFLEFQPVNIHVFKVIFKT